MSLTCFAPFAGLTNHQNTVFQKKLHSQNRFRSIFDEIRIFKYCITLLVSNLVENLILKKPSVSIEHLITQIHTMENSKFTICTIVLTIPLAVISTSFGEETQTMMYSEASVDYIDCQSEDSVILQKSQCAMLCLNSGRDGNDCVGFMFSNQNCKLCTIRTSAALTSVIAYIREVHVRGE